jgi:hypothetical protein
VALEEHGGIPGALAIQGTKIVYGTDLNGDVDVITVVPGTVAKCGKEDPANPGQYLMTNCVRIARSQGSLVKEVILAFGDWAYWIDSPSVKSGELAPPGTPANDQIGSTMTTLKSMATNPAHTNIYFTDGDSNDATAGTIWKTGINKSQVDSQVPLARNQAGAGSISVNATKVFWATDCAINSTAP